MTITTHYAMHGIEDRACRIPGNDTVFVNVLIIQAVQTRLVADVIICYSDTPGIEFARALREAGWIVVRKTGAGWDVNKSTLTQACSDACM